MGNHDETARSWAELHERRFNVPIDPGLGRFRAGLVFRGPDDPALAAMTTSLMRLGGDRRRKERHLPRGFRKHAHLDVRPSDSDSDWYGLALGQHYRLPTRLLDWTYSAVRRTSFRDSRSAPDGPGRSNLVRRRRRNQGVLAAGAAGAARCGGRPRLRRRGRHRLPELYCGFARDGAGYRVDSDGPVVLDPAHP